LFQAGSLTVGLAISLEHQPNNPYDKNAVAVLVRSTGAMLGHVSRDLAPKYAKLINSGRIIEADISDVSEKRGYISINIHVVYERSEEELAEKHNSLLWRSSLSMPAAPGVYAIYNTKTARQYIGSSSNVKNRILEHIRDLSHGCHTNNALQSDFSHFGANCFEVQLLEDDILISSLSLAESEHILKLKDEDRSLYNLTFDGKGVRVRTKDYSDSKPISDRPMRQESYKVPNQIDSIYTEKREKIYETCEFQCSELVPNTSVWVYFVVVLICTLILLAILIPNIKDGPLFVLSAIVSYVIAFLGQNYIQNKAKRSPKYQKLVQERDKQLAELEKEHRNLDTK
jgi:hypothetical protein